MALEIFPRLLQDESTHMPAHIARQFDGVFDLSNLAVGFVPWQDDCPPLFNCRPPFDAMWCEYNVHWSPSHHHEGWAISIAEPDTWPATVRAAQFLYHPTTGLDGPVVVLDFDIHEDGSLVAQGDYVEACQQFQTHLREGCTWDLLLNNPHLSKKLMHDYPEFGTPEEMVMSGVIAAIKSFYIALYAINLLHCTNVDVEQRGEALASPLNQRRLRKGKKPLVEHRVLKIKLSRGEGFERGKVGVRAHPRFHMVRGHFRRLESGKMTWIRPHTRGNELSGQLSKHYVIEE
jgi:hypothetical protein